MTEFDLQVKQQAERRRELNKQYRSLLEKTLRELGKIKDEEYAATGSHQLIRHTLADLLERI